METDTREKHTEIKVKAGRSVSMNRILELLDFNQRMVDVETELYKTEGRKWIRLKESHEHKGQVDLLRQLVADYGTNEDYRVMQEMDRRLS